jgi:hypothetical protein
LSAELVPTTDPASTSELTNAMNDACSVVPQGTTDAEPSFFGANPSFEVWYEMTAQTSEQAYGNQAPEVCGRTVAVACHAAVIAPLMAAKLTPSDAERLT